MHLDNSVKKFSNAQGIHSMMSRQRHAMYKWLYPLLETAMALMWKEVQAEYGGNESSKETNVGRKR